MKERCLKGWVRSTSRAHPGPHCARREHHGKGRGVGQMAGTSDGPWHKLSSLRSRRREIVKNTLPLTFFPMTFIDGKVFIYYAVRAVVKHDALYYQSEASER